MTTAEYRSKGYRLCRSCLEWFLPEEPRDHLCDACLFPERYDTNETRDEREKKGAK